MPERSTTLPDNLRADVQTLWGYHDMHHDLRPADVGIGLGSHDLGVATYTAELYQQGYFPRIVFTGATLPPRSSDSPAARRSTTGNTRLSWRSR